MPLCSNFRYVHRSHKITFPTHRMALVFLQISTNFCFQGFIIPLFLFDVFFFFVLVFVCLFLFCWGCGEGCFFFCYFFPKLFANFFLLTSGPHRSLNEWPQISWTLLNYFLIANNRPSWKRKAVKFTNNVSWFVVWVFMAYNLLEVIYRQIYFYVNNQFYFKQFSLTLVHSLIVKNISISSYSVFSIELIQFSINTDFVYTQLKVKTILYKTIQFCASTVSISKTVPFQTIQFSISTRFLCKYRLIVKNISFQAIQFSQKVLIQAIQFSISIQLVLFNP